jgi:hypothetical protein
MLNERFVRRGRGQGLTGQELSPRRQTVGPRPLSLDQAYSYLEKAEDFSSVTAGDPEPHPAWFMA